MPTRNVPERADSKSVLLRVKYLPKRTQWMMPEFIKSQLATLKTTAPKGDQWLHEVKYDGYRVQDHANRGRKKVLRPSLTKRFLCIAAANTLSGAG
jgi:bifunctional non-homologous end joining protein LigD